MNFKKNINRIKKSYGILCARFNNKTKKIEILLIQKRATFYYTDFILKNHIKYNENNLLYFFDHMTHDEKLDILSLDFSRMWYRIWMINPDFPHNSEEQKLSQERYEKYIAYKNNFEKNYLMDKGRGLKELINKSQHSECLWEIPKGRKATPYEKDMVCAMREFEEETGISSSEYYILDEPPLTMTNNSPNTKYINYYYIAIMPNIKNIKLNYNNIQQLSEVSKIEWMDLDKINLIDTNKKLYNLSKSANKMLRKKYKIQKVFELNLLQSLPENENIL